MKFLIVLAAAIACALAEPQYPFNTIQTGYPAYSGGVVPYPGYNGPMTYSANSMVYPYGMNTMGAYKRVRREAVYPYTHPVAYTGVTPFVHPYTYKTYSPVADVPKGYNYGYAGILGY